VPGAGRPAGVRRERADAAQLFAAGRRSALGSGPPVGDSPTADQRRPKPRTGRSDAAPPRPPADDPRRHQNQRAFGPEPVRRDETARATPVPRPLLPGLQLQPLVHVDDMAAAVAFYEQLGGEINHGDPSAAWVLMQVGTAQIGLVTRPPNPARGESTVELNFAATMPLDRLEHLLRERGVTVVAMTVDRDLGTQLHLETPEGMPIKIHQVEPELLV
jgi:predicted enzyme related to lactoylglutathione lyase